MIKQSVKNYFKCLKYVFTPLGIIALGFVCGLSVAIPGIIRSVSDMCSRIVSLSSDAINFTVLFDNIAAAVNALDWSSPMEALGTMFTKQWFNDTVINNLNKIIGDIESYITQIGNAISDCIDQIIAYAIVVVIFTIIAFIASYFLTRKMIRGDIAKRSFKNFIIGSIVGAVLWSACISLGIWFAFLWKNSIYITVIVTFLLACFVSLLNAYIVHGRKKVAFKSVVNLKNIVKLILSDLIIFSISIAITLLITLITNIIVGAFVFIGIIIVTIPVMEMTSESYVKELAENANNTQTAQPSNAEKTPDDNVVAENNNNDLYPQNS